tara:strand:- start:153 stop:641 length:489 start_codon:yes stop_codon:yes gene_type:complete
MTLNFHSILKLFWTFLSASILLISCAKFPEEHPFNQLFTGPSQVDKNWILGTGVPKSAVALDIATPEERVAATEQVAVISSKSLGSTIASLGNPAETGFWLKTPLISKTQPGRIICEETGKSVNVTLIPIDTKGSGSQVSLSALRLLGVPLADLPEIKVYKF